MVSEGSNHLLPGAAPDHLKMVEIKCEMVDVRVNKVLKILTTYGISLDIIYIRQADTSPGCKLNYSDSVRFHFLCYLPLLVLLITKQYREPQT
jgi:hypothetical protein